MHLKCCSEGWIWSGDAKWFSDSLISRLCWLFSPCLPYDIYLPIKQLNRYLFELELELILWLSCFEQTRLTPLTIDRKWGLRWFLSARNQPENFFDVFVATEIMFSGLRFRPQANELFTNTFCFERVFVTTCFNQKEISQWSVERLENCICSKFLHLGTMVNAVCTTLQQLKSESIT